MQAPIPVEDPPLGLIDHPSGIASKRFSAFQLTDSEDEASWKAFLVYLKDHGLLGTKFKLIITDGNPALFKAMKHIYLFTKGQRCIAHKMRNVGMKISKRLRTID